MAYMGNTNSKSKIKILTASMELTGKIDKLQALGGANNTSSLTEFRFGDINPTSTITGSDASIGGDRIAVPNGAVIEGPGTFVKVKDGDFLVYYRSSLASGLGGSASSSSIS